MSLLDGIEVACFDLFDTLIRIDVSQLPEVDFGDTKIRTTIPILYEEIFAPRGIALEDFVTNIRAIWSEVRRELQQTEGSDDERYKEVAAVDKYRRLLGRMPSIPEDETDALAEQIATLHHASLVGAALPVEGAIELLERVRERGISTALVSNWDHAKAGDAMLAQTGLANLLDHVVISEAVGIRKPHPRIFSLALEPFGASPDAALHVGDLAEADAWGAGRLGFRTIWIDRAEEGWPSELEPAPSARVTRLAELLERL